MDSIAEIKCSEQEWKTTTLIDRYKEENTETESQPEVDNGVHPLHWAISPGPSPMGTDPINGFKNGTNGSSINLSICRNRMLDRKSSRLLSGTYNLDFKR